MQQLIQTTLVSFSLEAEIYAKKIVLPCTFTLIDMQVHGVHYRRRRRHHRWTNKYIFKIYASYYSDDAHNFSMRNVTILRLI